MQTDELIWVSGAGIRFSQPYIYVLLIFLEKADTELISGTLTNPI